MKREQYIPIEIILKDGMKLKCMIYETNNKGELPIIDVDRIHYKLSKDRIGKDEYVYFQTEMINGKFHPQNIENVILSSTYRNGKYVLQEVKGW
jgi:hypothetical protein